MNLFFTILSFSSSSFIIIWMSMEVSSFFFIPLILSSGKSLFIQSMWKYYLSQIMASFLFFYAILISDLSSEMDKFIFILSMMMKLGAYPFVGWVINLQENMGKVSFFLLSSTQKLIPLFLLSFFSEKSSFVMSFSLMGIIMTLSFFFLKKSIRTMMIVSSLFNLNWLIFASIQGEKELLFYVFVYFYFFFAVILILLKDWSEESSFLKGSEVKNGKFLESLNLLMLMGTPPLGVFLVKLELLINYMNISQSLILSLLFYTLTSVSSYVYLKFFFNLSLFSSSLMEEKKGLSNSFLNCIMIGWFFFSFLLFIFL